MASSGAATPTASANAHPRTRQGRSSTSSGWATAGTDTNACTMPSAMVHTISRMLKRPKSAGWSRCAAQITVSRFELLEMTWSTVTPPTRRAVRVESTGWVSAATTASE